MRRTSEHLARVFPLAATLALAGCGGGTTASASPAGVPPTQAPVPPIVEHIVVVVQENRTFDNLFHGFPGADTANSGRTTTGQIVPLHTVALADPYDLGHGHQSFIKDFNGGAGDGFNLEPTSPKTAHPPPDPAYAYVDRNDIAAYWQMATQYTLADRMFQSNSGPSYPAHQYLIAGQSAFADENPTFPKNTPPSDELGWGCDDPPGTEVPVLAPDGDDEPGSFPCNSYSTLAALLDAHGVTWAYYAANVSNPGGGYIWSAYDAIKSIRRGPDWSNDVRSPQTSVLDDIAAGRLRQVSYVTPSALNSDHAHSNNGTGPAWVSAVVNAVGRSKYWKNTVVIVTWDDWGGWYDHVVPPQIDRMGLGFRVPLLVISPYAKRGYVSHVQHEFGSVLHFVEERFGLGTLGQRDAISDDLSDCFDFAQTPTPFMPISAPGPRFNPNDRTAAPPPDDD